MLFANPMNRVRAKIAGGRLITPGDVARLSRQLDSTPTHLPEYLDIANMIRVCRRVAYAPPPLWYRAVRFLGICAARMVRRG